MKWKLEICTQRRAYDLATQGWPEWSHPLRRWVLTHSVAIGWTKGCKVIFIFFLLEFQNFKALAGTEDINSQGWNFAQLLFIPGQNFPALTRNTIQLMMESRRFFYIDRRYMLQGSQKCKLKMLLKAGLTLKNQQRWNRGKKKNERKRMTKPFVEIYLSILYENTL